MNEEIKNEIQKLKKEKDAVILAHYYVDGEVQEIADYVGDSYYLAEIATKVPESTIVFCGVSFMGESAKILNPKKRVVMADGHADCPMAHMVDVDKIREVRNEYPDVSVVCYVNSTAEIKAESDVCVTSSNALKIVKNLPNKDIFFIPDENLGRFVASQLPEKHFIFNDGFCHVHTSIHKEELQKAKEAHPEALVLTHPECTGDILELSDFIGSTSQIIDYATKSENNTFIICTEMGVFLNCIRKIRRRNSTCEKGLAETVLSEYEDGASGRCEEALETMQPEVNLDEEMRQAAALPLEKMLNCSAVSQGTGKVAF